MTKDKYTLRISISRGVVNGVPSLCIQDMRSGGRTRESPEEFGPLIYSRDYILPVPTARHFAEEVPRQARMPHLVMAALVKMPPARRNGQIPLPCLKPASLRDPVLRTLY